MGVGIGGFAQGLAGGLGQGVQIATAIDRDKREQERFAFEKPRLKADAAKAEQDLAFQTDLRDSMGAFMAEARGSEGVDEEGVPFSKPALDPIDMQIRSAEIMKEAMFRHGKIDFAQLKAANDFTKELQSEGVLEAMRYAMANPTDQDGIRKMFNTKGKMKLGDDIQIGVEDGMFGPNVVGYKVGANGKQVKAFDGAEILMPYLGAQSFATMKQQQRLAEVQEKGANTRTGISAGATIESARIRERGESNRLIYNRERDDKTANATAIKDDLKSIASGVTSDTTGALRNQMGALDANRTILVNREVAALAERTYLNDARYRGRPNQAVADARSAVFQKYGISIDPTFQPLNKKK